MDDLTKMAIYAREHGMTYGKLQQQIAQGKINLAAVLMDEDRRKPVPVSDDGLLHIVNGKITYKGETMWVKDWAARYGVNASTIKERIRRGLPADYVFYAGRVQGGEKR